MAKSVVRDLSFTYPNGKHKALDGVSFDVREGEFVLVVGRSGCGKSTLLRSLKPLLAPHGERTGEILFDGRSVDSLTEREQAERIGFVFQHPDDQIVTDKVWHELAFGLESLGLNRSVMRARAAEMASYFKLDSVFMKDVSELSGGQKQLVNLASVMAMKPDLLILDEPTSQLDPIAASDFLATVKKLNTELGITVILSEHRLEEAMPFADRVLVMEEGRVSVFDEPRKAGRRLFETGSDMFHAMPTALKLSCALSRDETALTVNEGRSMLLSMGLTPKMLPGTERKEERFALFTAKEVFFRFTRDGADILDGLDISLYSNEIFGIVGANGAGKTTLLNMISGKLVPYRGKLTVKDRRLKGRFSARDEGISHLPQDPRVVFTQDTVRQELESVSEDIKDVVSLMELEGLLDMNPYDLSGGEQQRAAIAKVLLNEPKLLLLDEPTKGMDAAMKRVLGSKLLSLKEKGISILLVTHDVEFCAEYADRVGFMFRGSIVAENTAREFFSENTFYTTAANRIARDIYKNALTCEEVTALAKR